METYERLICDLGRRLLTKGLNNDFSESGRDLGKDVTAPAVRMRKGGKEGRGGAHRERGARSNVS